MKYWPYLLYVAYVVGGVLLVLFLLSFKYGAEHGWYKPYSSDDPPPIYF